MTKADTTCKDVIKACDQALADRDQKEAAQKTAFDDAMKALSGAQGRADAAEEKLNAWYRNPVIDFALGLVGGIVLEQVVVNRR